MLEVCDEDHHSDNVDIQFHSSRQIPLVPTPAHTLTHTLPFQSYPVSVKPLWEFSEKFAGTVDAIVHIVRMVIFITDIRHFSE